MRRLLMLLLMTCAASAASAQAPCVIVYGNGRNVGDARENAAWDRANLNFNAQVVARLTEAGLRAVPMVFKVGEVAPRASVELLIAEAQRQGCRRVVDTAVFANEESAALVVRLRVHPLLASLGPRVTSAQPTIGEPLFTSQRDFDLSRALESLQLDLLARQMADGYLAEQAGATAAPVSRSNP